ncbi:MAG: NADP-dependent oxidoreductase [Chloroflexi bacterium]|nr:NADP-dependent oxidoreductase [Chloroflexota bacterium]
MSNGTMQAIRFHEYGGPEKLVLDTLERPAPKEGEVLLKVHAAGVNPVDWKFRAGYLQQWMPIQLPYVPGNDVAGTVEEVGPGVTEFRKGQAVYGLAQGGTYAQYVVVPASQLAPMPKNLSFDEAASVPVGALTAWHALFTYADLQAGQTVLVHGGAGGVGAFAVQLAHWKGAKVIATASADNLDFVRSLGADTVIDYNATQFETVVRDVDVVVDTVGGDVLQRSWQVLRPGGILVSITEPPSEEEAKKRGVRAAMVQTAFTGEDLRRITELIESGQLKPELGPVFRLTDADKAQELSQTRHGRGRIVLHIAD